MGLPTLLVFWARHARSSVIGWVTELVKAQDSTLSARLLGHFSSVRSGYGAPVFGRLVGIAGWDLVDAARSRVAGNPALAEQELMLLQEYALWKADEAARENTQPDDAVAEPHAEPDSR